MASDLQTRQRAFDAAAAQLRPDGYLIVETYSPLFFLRGSNLQHHFAPLGQGNQMYLDKIMVDGAQQRLPYFRVTPRDVDDAGGVSVRVSRRTRSSCSNRGHGSRIEDQRLGDR